MKHHLEELKEETERYFQTNPGAMVPDPGSPKENPTYTFQAVKPIPAKFGLIAGDCVQNLRSSLDYLVWELVTAAGNKPSRKNMFPICPTPDNFKEALQKRERLKGVNTAAISVIERVQPFQFGGGYTQDTLWILDELTNINKHRRVLLTTLGSAARPETAFTQAEGNPCSYDPMPDVDKKPTFEALKSIGGMEANARLSAFMVFDEECVRNQIVTNCLGIWTEYVGDKVIPQFGRFFS